MLSEILQDRAALYVSGEMTAPDREAFDVILEYHEELREHVAGLREATATAALTRVAPASAPAGLRHRLLGALDGATQDTGSDALVVTDAGGRVEWVNAEFTGLCGYELAELKGRKPGQLLQGPDTDPAAVERIRAALRERRACRETIVNYHKDGSRYRADVRISPVPDDDGNPLWFVARERRVPEMT